MSRQRVNPLQGSDPNADMVAGATARGEVTTQFWGGGGRPTLNRRFERPQYLATGVRFDEVTHERARQIIARYPHQRSAIMPLLHLTQSVEGFVSSDAVTWVADLVDVKESEVNGVASFYNMYKREPVGEHIVSVCTNALCAALGGDEIYRALEAELGIEDHGTAGEPGTPGSVTIEHVQCLAACDCGPVLTVDYELFDNVTPQSAVELVQALRRGEKPVPTRGAPLRDFRTASLELAGFLDDVEENIDAPSAAAPSLRGAQLAADHGWKAPAMPDTPPAMPDVPEKK